MYPYKLQIVQSLEPQDYDLRLEMCETLVHRYEQDPNILEQMWFSDEAVFHTSGKVHRHNTRFWEKRILFRSANIKEIHRSWLFGARFLPLDSLDLTSSRMMMESP